ncbi:MAG: 5-formyltetrahydrofolate cyclo-ligase [Thermoguttaceae bacterium]|jgi:5-formyltetrahydrofolate cyclo-ligase
MPDSLDEALQKKQELRLTVAALRGAQQEADLLSRRIWDKMLALPQFARARTVMTYLDIGSEVRTRAYLPELWQLGKRVVVPYCMAREIRLFQVKKMDELSPGTWQILEPKPEWLSRMDRRVDASELDLIVVPGVAFDRYGDRLGLGKGYYDRFLQRVRPDAVKISPAFECQLVDKIPVLPHDVRVDMVITENYVYRAGERV